MELLDLFLVFAKMGAFTFGGGYAMLPIIQREIVEKRGWASEEEILTYYGIGQCTPGIIAINTATFIGYKRKGIIGGVVATLGMVMPSLIIISLLAGLIGGLGGSSKLGNSLGAIRIVVVALILTTVYDMFKKNITDLFSLGLCLTSFLLVSLVNISPVVVVSLSFLLGWAYYKDGVV